MPSDRLRLLLTLPLVLGLFLSIPARPDPHQRESRGDGDQLSLTVSVTDKTGKPVQGLTKQDFSILIDKSPPEIVFFEAGDAPESVAFVVDLSGSLRDSRSSLQAAARQLSQFPLSSSPGSEFLGIGFNERVSVLVDWTSDKDALTQAIMGLGKVVPKGTTAFFDACLLAINKSTETASRRKFILLLTDGQDNNSKTNYDHLRKALQSAPVTIYSIGVIDPHDALAGFGRAILEELSLTSGGTAFFLSGPARIADAITAASLRMRQSYQIALRKASLPADGKYHKIVVKVGQGSGGKSPYTVTAPQGFWAKQVQ